MDREKPCQQPTTQDGQSPKKCIECSAINLCTEPRDQEAREWRKYRTGR